MLMRATVGHGGDMVPSAMVDRTQLLTKGELLRELRARSLVVEPLLDADSQIDATGIDLRLDCFFREFVRTQAPYISPAASPDGGTVLREIDPFCESFYLQ